MLREKRTASFESYAGCQHKHFQNAAFKSPVLFWHLRAWRASRSFSVLKIIFPRNILDKWNPQHAACPCDYQSVWGNRVKHTLNCTILCQAKLNFIMYFFPQNIYVCTAVFTELQSISCWPTECITLLPTSHFKMITLATSMKFAYFRLLLRNSKIASSKTVIHPRMGTIGIEHWTVPEPILCPWNQPDCFDCAYIFEKFQTEGLYPDGLVEMVPDSSEIPFSSSCHAVIMYQDADINELAHIDVGSKSCMPLKIRFSRWVMAYESCLSVKALVYCHVWKSDHVYAVVYTFF